MKHYPKLDALRFFAFFGVFLSHAISLDPHSYAFLGPFASVPVTIAQAGRYGVDLFFVLSAYLIISLLLIEHDRTGRIDSRAFYLRRILRIWPLYYVFLIFSVLVVPALIPGQEVTTGWVLAFGTFTGNWYIDIFYWPSSVVLPLWTVSIEEQFYLFSPFLVQRRRLLPYIAVGLAILAVAVRLYMAAFAPQGLLTWTNTFMRLDPIAGGIALAIVFTARPPAWSRRVSMALICGGALALPILNYLLASQMRRIVGTPLITLACMALVAGCLTQHFSTPRVFVWLGRRSYGLYVVHVFVLALTGYYLAPLLQALPGGLFVVALLLTIGIAAALYRWLEMPFLTLKQRYVRAQVSGDINQTLPKVSHEGEHRHGYT